MALKGSTVNPNDKVLLQLYMYVYTWSTIGTCRNIVNHLMLVTFSLLHPLFYSPMPPSAFISFSTTYILSPAFPNFSSYYLYSAVPFCIDAPPPTPTVVYFYVSGFEIDFRIYLVTSEILKIEASDQGEHTKLSFWVCATSLNMIFFYFHSFIYKVYDFILLYSWIAFHSVYIYIFFIN